MLRARIGLQCKTCMQFVRKDQIWKARCNVNNAGCVSNRWRGSCQVNLTGLNFCSSLKISMKQTLISKFSLPSRSSLFISSKRSCDKRSVEKVCSESVFAEWLAWLKVPVGRAIAATGSNNSKLKRSMAKTFKTLLYLNSMRTETLSKGLFIFLNLSRRARN